MISCGSLPQPKKKCDIRISASARMGSYYPLTRGEGKGLMGRKMKEKLKYQ